MKLVMSLQPLSSGSKNRGVGVYTRELTEALQKNYPHDTIVPTSREYYSLASDIVHFPFFDPFFLTLPASKKLPTVVTIHDLTPIKFPEHFKAGIRGKYRWWKQKARARKVDHIITDSEVSKQDIISIMGIKAEGITVIPLAPSNERVPAMMAKKIAIKYKLPEKYLLYVGDINWNKNVVGLVDAFAQIKDPSVHLVLIGKVFSDAPNIPEYKRIIDAIVKSGKADLIHQIGYVPGHHLPVFYTRATLYVQPSWYEGFGLPVLEAMSYGCPVASSDRGSLPEVGGDAVAYFDPSVNMVKVITKLLSSTRKRNQLALAGLVRSKDFTWEKVAEATYKVYKKYT